MAHDDRIKIQVASPQHENFLEVLREAQTAWAAYPDKANMSDRERIDLLGKLIALQQAYLIHIGIGRAAEGNLGELTARMQIAAMG